MRTAVVVACSTAKERNRARRKQSHDESAPTLLGPQKSTRSRAGLLALHRRCILHLRRGRRRTAQMARRRSAHHAPQGVTLATPPTRVDTDRVSRVVSAADTVGVAAAVEGSPRTALAVRGTHRVGVASLPQAARHQVQHRRTPQPQQRQPVERGRPTRQTTRLTVQVGAAKRWTMMISFPFARRCRRARVRRRLALTSSWRDKERKVESRSSTCAIAWHETVGRVCQSHPL